MKKLKSALYMLILLVCSVLGVKSSFQQAVWGSSTPSGYDSYGGHQSPASPGYGRGVTLPGQGEDTVHTNKGSWRSAWTPWSDWSHCSRPCDGGVARQLRKCVSRSRERCRDESIRYKICNMQPCPDIQDFRAHQCAAYNQVPYEGALLTWTPHYEETEPCALTCRGSPHSHPQDSPLQFGEADEEAVVVAQLASRVQDGTRCRHGSLDMCIDGKCQRVGCDLRIGSNRRVDECGVCGGDGSSCARPLYQWDLTPMSLCSVTCGGGYRMSRPVCRNRVSGADVEEQLCNAAQKPEPTVQQCNNHQCPPKWNAGEWSECSATCGGGTRTRRVQCAIHASNGSYTPVTDEACIGHRPRHMESCADRECPQWLTASWSGCSVSCGSGVQVRNVQCSEGPSADSSMEMPSIPCSLASRPPTSRPCSTGIVCPIYHDSGSEDDIEDLIPGVVYHTQPLIQPYPPPQAKAEKLIGDQVVPSEATFIKDAEWGPCSVTCGEGVRKREVHCKIFLEFSRTIAKLPDYKCTGPKPSEETERCVMEPCSMAYGTSYGDSNAPTLYPRDIYRASNYGDPNIRVAPETPGKSYSWREQGYTHCSASCLGGVQELIINCVRDDTEKIATPYMCAPETKPESRIKTCNDHPCPPRWNYSDFSPCTASCGIGIQTREVSCIHEVTRGGGNTVIVPSSMCPQPPPPDRQYCNVLDCPVRWHTTEWSKCSKPCGGGSKTRKVECKQIMAQSHVIQRQDSLCPSGKPPSTKICNNKVCPTDNSTPNITTSNTSFIQHNTKKKKINLKIGGSATVFSGTQIKIKCPVKRFNRTKIMWEKDHSYISKSKKFKISKKGALRIQDLTTRDSGIYTCIAGKSKADLNLIVKQRPGEFPSSEEIERQKANPLDDPNDSVDRNDGRYRPFIGGAEDHSHEQRPGADQTLLSKQRERMKEKARKLELEKEREREREREKQMSTTTPLPVRYYPPPEDDYSDKDSGSGAQPEDAVPTQMSIAGDIVDIQQSSSASRPMPHFLRLLSNLQAFSNSRGQRMINELNYGLENKSDSFLLNSINLPPLTSSFETKSFFDDNVSDISNFGSLLENNSIFTEQENYSTVNDVTKNFSFSTISNEEETTDSITVLGKGSADDLKFKWIITDWSECSQTCGGGGFQIRAAQCMVELENTTQNVEASLCDDAELETPKTIQKCGLEACPVWQAKEWSPCSRARCFDWNTAMQRRVVQCLGGNVAVSPSLCNTQERPPHRQECYNDKCKGVWRTDHWSECGGPCGEQGARYRILSCVWFGTKKPAGSACRHRPRPVVVKPCIVPPCQHKNSDCKDTSKFCQNVRAMNMCRVQRYQSQCCQSCRKH